MPVSTDFLRQVFDIEHPPAASRLLALSSLADSELSVFRFYWERAGEEARTRLVERLSELAEDNAEANFDAVFRVALDDESAVIRERAIQALWECQERWLLNRLTSMAEQDASENVRASASSALGKFVLLGALEEIRASLVEQVESSLRRIIDKPGESLHVRRRAIEALGASADPTVNDIIRSSYYSDEPELKAAAVYAMGQHCDPNWLPVLLSELKSADPAMRFEAARACGELEDDRAVPSLIALLKETDPEVQEAAIEALGRIGGDAAKRALKKCASQGDERVRQAAQEALDEIAIDDDPFRF